ncbi:outer membrane efflux protein [Legionella waltersii]|uniref:Outer membrane efflux protein n=2 Tax=Legionella waltersii TaxID=66969 RepID=A0A0W1A5E6_9GAMM|nr:outer membrane efflux protein [Legionella waltersii]SNU94444.1 outer membrane efflux protein [Legionella waltersii]
MLKKLFSLIVIGISLISCSHRPMATIATPKQFPSIIKEYKPAKELPCLAWWKQFHDSELDRLIEIGLQNNMDIHVALGNLQQAQGELRRVKLSWIPYVQLFGGYSTNPALGVPGGFYGVWPNYALNIMQLFTQQKQAKYQVQYYEAAIDGMRLVLIGQVTASYFTLSAQLEQLRLLTQLDKDLNALIKIGEQDVKIGLNNDIELAQLKSNEQLIAAQIKPVKHNIVVSQNALRYLINENPGPVKTKTQFSQLDFTQFKPGSLPMSVLANRPDMKMAYYALKSARAGVLVSYSDFFPLMQLDDFIGEAHLPNNTFEQATDAYFNWTIKPSSVGKIAASKGAYYAKMAEYIKTVRFILKEVDNAFSANQRMNEQFLSYWKAQKNYESKYKLQDGLVKTGLLSNKELLESKIYLDNLALSTNQAKLELAMSLVLLYQDLAGGYAYNS